MKSMISMALALTLTTGLVAQEKLTVDASKSQVNWTGKKITGEHSGLIKMKEGTVMMSGNVLTGVNAVIDMTTITNTDLKDEAYRKKLEGHLHSPDFFNTAKFQEATFNATKVIPINGKAGSYMVTGDLTIKGTTHPAEFEVITHMHDGMMHAEGTLVFDRSKYDVRYGSGSFFEGLGDDLIYDDVSLTFSISAQKG